MTSATSRLLSLIVTAILLVPGLFGGCASPTDEAVAEQEVVTTNLTTYTQGQNIVVSFTNMQGASSDWIAIARTTDSDSVYWAYAYTGGATSGTVTFTMPTFAPGTYEARAFYDWNGTQSFTVQQRSAPFTITGNTSLSPSSATYPLGQAVTINYTGFSGSTTDWVAIYKPGAADGNYIAWQFTGGGTSGMVMFSGLPTGTYEARYHPDWNGTHSFSSAATSSTFTISGSTTVTTDRQVYGQGDPVTVSYANLPGNMLDYVAVSEAGSSPGATVQWFYTNGNVTGSQLFTGLAPGNYEARVYANDSTTMILASSPFTVTGASVMTDASTYPANGTVTVSYAGLPGNPMDWIGIATAGSPDSSHVQLVYTGGATAGTATFTNLPAGTYEARAYVNNTFSVIARSSTFSVGMTCNVTTAPVFESLTTGQLVIGAAEATVTVPVTAALDRSILFMTVREREQSPQHGAVQCDLHAADAALGIPAGVTCRRNFEGTDTADSTGAITVKWTVATFSSGVTVQRGIARTYPTNPANVALTTIDPAKSFVILGGVFGAGTGWGNNEFTRARIVDATTLEIAHGAVGAQVAWQVVSMDGASVQRGTTTLATAATTQSVSVMDVPTGSLVLASYSTDNPSGIRADALMLQASLQGANSILLERSTGGAALDVAWEVVSLPFATRLGVSTFGPNVSAKTESVPGIAAASSVAIGTMQSILGQSSGLTTFTSSDLVGESAATMTTSTDVLTLQRASTTSTAQIAWSVIDFSKTCAGN